MISDDYESRLDQVWSSGTYSQKVSRVAQKDALMRLAPIIRQHPLRWREFLVTEDEEAWDAHQLFLGQRLLDYHDAAREGGLVRFCCVKGTGGCDCEGCLFIEELQENDLLHRDHHRLLAGGATPAQWMRAAMAFHARWLNKESPNE